MQEVLAVPPDVVQFVNEAHAYTVVDFMAPTCGSIGDWEQWIATKSFALALAPAASGLKSLFRRCTIVTKLVFYIVILGKLNDTISANGKEALLLTVHT